MSRKISLFVKKRLRKKKKLGEFKEEGFSLKVDFVPDLNDASINQFIDELIDLMEEHKMLMGGGSLNNTWEAVIFRHKQSTTQDDKAAVLQWLKERPGVASYEVSKNWDVWHGKAPF